MNDDILATAILNALRSGRFHMVADARAREKS